MYILTLSTTLTCAFAVNKSLHVSKWPPRALQCNGVQPAYRDKQQVNNTWLQCCEQHMIAEINSSAHEYVCGVLLECTTTQVTVFIGYNTYKST